MTAAISASPRSMQPICCHVSGPFTARQAGPGPRKLPRLCPKWESNWGFAAKALGGRWMQWAISQGKALLLKAELWAHDINQISECFSSFTFLKSFWRSTKSSSCGVPVLLIHSRNSNNNSLSALAMTLCGGPGLEKPQLWWGDEKPNPADVSL